VPVLRLVAFAMPFVASTVVITYALRGAGDTRVPVLFTWTGFLCLRIPLAYLFTSKLSIWSARHLAWLQLGIVRRLAGHVRGFVVRGALLFMRFLAAAGARFRYSRKLV